MFPWESEDVSQAVLHAVSAEADLPTFVTLTVSQRVHLVTPVSHEKSQEVTYFSEFCASI